jgi:hypothetical protein
MKKWILVFILGSMGSHARAYETFDIFCEAQLGNQIQKTQFSSEPGYTVAPLIVRLSDASGKTQGYRVSFEVLPSTDPRAAVTFPLFSPS